jgi:hypothetical protein
LIQSHFPPDLAVWLEHGAVLTSQGRVLRRYSHPYLLGDIDEACPEWSEFHDTAVPF